MASLAGLLKKMGHDVAGSDKEIYPPMSDMLNDLKIKIYSPYNAFHVKQYKPDIVVIGNAIGRGNAELEYVLSNGQTYRSFPEVLREEIIGMSDKRNVAKKAIVITGTHGKTTTTALTAWILEHAGLNPTVFVGGFTGNFNSSFKLNKGKYIVIEGDEYDTSFFDKGPKFWHYRPFIGLVNNIELDHVDIYKDLDAVKFSFSRFMNLIPNNGLLIVNREDKNTYDLSMEKRKSPVSTFGINGGDYYAKKINFSEKGTTFKLFNKGHFITDIETKLIGYHNISNILGAIVIAKFLKIPENKISGAIKSFNGVKRRCEIIGDKNGKIVINDYAHHPTAVAKTLDSIRLMFPVKRLFVVFEPGSASSKRKIFENEYIKAFRHADLAYIYRPFHVEQMNKRQVFSGTNVSRKLKKSGFVAKNFDSMDKMLFHMKHDSKSGDVIIIMSCRGFDGLPKKILEIL